MTNNPNNNSVKFSLEKSTPKRLVELFQSSVHLGHKINCWNPKMFSYIYTAKNGQHIIDLVQTAQLFDKACDFIYEAALEKKTILFIGTKTEAAPIIEREAKRCNCHYINSRWLGGMLTNWTTIKRRIKRLKELEQKKADGIFDLLSNKEASIFKKELDKLRSIFNGIKEMETIPDIIVIVDQNVDLIAVQEAIILNIPIIAILDTNCDPDLVDIPIPANDDSILSIQLILTKLADSILHAKNSSKTLEKY